jgi:hypothetical protein
MMQKVPDAGRAVPWNPLLASQTSKVFNNLLSYSKKSPYEYFLDAIPLKAEN